MTLTEFVPGRIPAVLLRSEEFVRSVGIGVFGFGLGPALEEGLLLVLRETVPATPHRSTLSPWFAATRFWFGVLQRSGPNAQRSGNIVFVTPSVLWSFYSVLRFPADYWEVTCIAIAGGVDTTAAMTGAIAGALELPLN